MSDITNENGNGKEPRKIKDEFFWIPVDSIDILPGFNYRLVEESRESFEQFKRLVKRNGVTTPLIVQKRKDDRYALIAGHRRLKAVKELIIDGENYKSIRCQVIPTVTSERELYEIAYVENFHNGIEPIEKAALAYMFVKKFGMETPEVAEKLSLSHNTVIQYLDMYQKLDETTLDAIKKGDIKFSAAGKLAREGKNVEGKIIDPEKAEKSAMKKQLNDKAAEFMIRLLVKIQDKKIELQDYDDFDEDTLQKVLDFLWDKFYKKEKKEKKAKEEKIEDKPTEEITDFEDEKETETVVDEEINEDDFKNLLSDEEIEDEEKEKEEDDFDLGDVEI